MYYYKDTFYEQTACKGPRDFSYTTLPSDERYQNRTVLFAFVGRQDRLQVQLPYLEQLVLDGEIDYVHYYLCGTSQQVRDWLKTFQNETLPWFEIREHTEFDFTKTKVDAHFIAAFNTYRDSIYNSTTLVKVDDDIIFFPFGGDISQIVDYTKSTPEAAWVSGLVINHPLFNNFLQRDGVIPLTAELDFTDEHRADNVYGNTNTTTYNEHKAFWSALHSYFMENTTSFRGLSGIYEVEPGSRTSLNFMVFPQHRVFDWNLRGQEFDEWSIGVIWTKKTNTSVHVFKGAPSVHFDYGKQRQIPGMVNETYINMYLEFGCRQIVLHRNQSMGRCGKENDNRTRLIFDSICV